MTSTPLSPDISNSPRWLSSEPARIPKDEPATTFIHRLAYTVSLFRSYSITHKYKESRPTK